MKGLFPDEHLRFMSETVVKYETDSFYLCHAGVEKGLPLKDQALYDDYFLLWGDEEFLEDETDYGKVIVFGHYHMDSPFIRFRKVGIALKDDVALFDLRGMTIVDSQGNMTAVDKKFLEFPS